jgi:glycosyltransferase involved in cell wall biosynthesis
MQMAKSTTSGAIGKPYLLVIGIPIYVDDHGVHWADPLWHKDLVRHLDYLNDFFLACPHIAGTPPAGWISLEGYPIHYVPIPRQLGRFRSVLTGPATFVALWRAIQHVDVVHTGVGGWYPWSTSNIAAAISILLKRFRITIVESSTWRLLPGEPAWVGKRIDSSLSEWANRISVGAADLSIFTHAEYKRSLLRKNSTRGHVIHASWINENDILSDTQARECWSRKRESGLVRFLFAGRLSPSKGVRQLLQALKLLQDVGSRIFLDIMGSGELEDECRAFLATSVDSSPNVRMVAPVQYGPEFFDCLRSYSAVLVPSLGDEQPRIVYDALAVAVPPLASSTVGIADCVEDGVTGRLFRPGSADELANAMKWAISSSASLETMGMRGLERARSMTHSAMHQQRLALLLKALV